MRYSKIKAIHKVTCDSPVPVYDIEVKNNHNFAVSDGLIVHNCKPYQYFKNTIYEERIEMYDSTLLTTEILGLERNGNSGKIDHPDEGKSGSKDACDAVCGSLWNASQHADEYNFEFGEDLEAAVSASIDNFGLTKEQITVDFENELKKVSPFHDELEELGYDRSFAYLMDGIIL